MKKLLLIVNPASGRAQIKNNLMEVIDIFIKGGYQVTTYITQARGDATEMAKHAGEYDLVVCTGGDGTFNETMKGLMCCDPRPSMGYIPAGTANILGVNLDFPRHIPDSAKLTMEKEPRGMDIGTLNGVYFSLVAGFGAFTDMSYQTPQPMKQRMGPLAYLVEGIATLPNIKGQDIRLECDGKVIEDNILTGLITNVAYITRILGLPYPKAETQTMDDGLFDILMVKTPTTPLEWQQSANSLLTMEPDSPHFYRLQAAEVHLTTASELPWTLDGEFGGTWKEVEIINHKQKLQLIRP